MYLALTKTTIAYKISSAELLTILAVYSGLKKSKYKI